MSVINTNVKALAAAASANSVEKTTATAMERLSTGLRINSAKDDAAGLAITNRMTTQIRGYAVAIRNVNDGLSMAQTADGALSQVSSILQRMREIAVQASNGALTNADRSNLNLEVSQLKKEIDNIANLTNHNNIKLLDGTAGTINLQTGVNAAESIAIGFKSAKTKDIGEGTIPALSSNAVATTALSAGDLLINGVSVGASIDIDDTLSTASASGSAIAKAAAINRVAAQSGVTATVGKTTSYGASMTAAAGTGTITINGVATDTLTTTTDAEASRTVVAAAINNISSRTGVRAINTGDDKQGVVLVADDGRNIVVGAVNGTLTAANTGVTHSTTMVGNYTLTSKDNSPITLGSIVGGSISKSGLSIGTFASSVAQTVSGVRAQTAANTAPSDSTTGVLNGNTLIINDVQIAGATAGDDAASYVSTTSTKAASAIAIAAAINKSKSVTGVTAKAEANTLYGTAFTAGTVDAFAINGVSIISAATLTTNRDQMISLINSKSGQTGVVADANGGGIKLTAADGRNITVGVKTGTAANVGLTGVTVGTDVTDATVVTYYSKVSLSSDKEFTVRSGSESNSNFALLGFRAGTFGGSGDGQKIASVDVSTSSGANRAMRSIDAALENVSEMSALTGSFQNRLDAVVANLTEANQNMSAARSRILDADYATETTSLARSQIIQQAATAMLAQANQSAQTVLALLK